MSTEKEAALRERTDKTVRFFYNALMRGAEAADIELTEDDIDNDVFFEVIAHYLKDMDRISEHQREMIAPQNMLGFIMFWICKLKPIQVKNLNAPDANERCAIYMAHAIFRLLPGKFATAPAIAQITGTVAEKSKRLDRAIDFYICGNGHTLLYSLRHRNLTGDAFTLLFGSILTMAAFWESKEKVGV